jgi:hypothetical protein
MKHWWCMECQVEVELNKHGRCGICESEGVDLLSAEGELSSTVSDTPTDTQSVSASA